MNWKANSGWTGSDPARLPVDLGSELAGVVAAVGPDVDSVQVGGE